MSVTPSDREVQLLFWNLVMNNCKNTKRRFYREENVQPVMWHHSKWSPGKQQSADRAGGQEGWRTAGQEGRGEWWLSRGSQGLGPMWMWASPAASWTRTTRLWGPKHRWPPTKCTHMVSEPQGNQSIANPLPGTLNIWEIFRCIF